MVVKAREGMGQSLDTPRGTHTVRVAAEKPMDQKAMGKAITLARAEIFQNEGPAHEALAKGIKFKPQPEKALAALDSAIGKYEAVKNACGRLADALDELGEHEEARLALVRAFEIAKDMNMALELKAQALNSLGRDKEARELFKKAAGL